jgi:hypothetical protein
MASAAAIPKDVNPSAPYRSPEDAIITAFRTEADEIVAVSSFFSDMRGGSVRGVPHESRDSDPYADHAQAAMLFAFLEQNLTTEEWLVVRARHTIPKRGMLLMRKEADTELVFQHFVARSSQRFSLAYAKDCVRRWCGFRCEREDDAWAMELGRSIGTLRTWRNGDRRRGRDGFMRPVEVVYGEAVGKLVEPMFLCGLTRE